MNREIGNEWVGRLRSGNYRQTVAHLGGEQGFCCLGVLCEMAVEAGIVDRREVPGFDPLGDGGQKITRFTYGTEDEGWVGQFLPMRVFKWAGLPGPSPTVHGTTADIDYDSDTDVSLAGLNDKGASFAQIAELIESRLLDDEPVPA